MVPPFQTELPQPGEWYVCDCRKIRRRTENDNYELQKDASQRIFLGGFPTEDKAKQAQIEFEQEYHLLTEIWQCPMPEKGFGCFGQRVKV
jgi:hypothetical protein